MPRVLPMSWRLERCVHFGKQWFALYGYTDSQLHVCGHDCRGAFMLRWFNNRPDAEAAFEQAERELLAVAP